ncbi:hypothetical protein QYE76_052848 [Lolium multiflorum]|uniref:Retrotransposon gag domain-containing protein n=1 Tax=Lolium multiflorum TaxID=4521 RepID=A0AAD8WJI5_LOLMU|nr:hypothetical protein QYE76_052848 [Lolium multiflorum]
MAEEQITYEDLPPDHKKKYDELKAIVEAELIGSFEKTRSHGIRFKGFTPQGVLDGVDLSLPSDERTRALRQEVNYMVAHSLHRHSESLVNTLERVALRVVQEIMERRYSPSGPVLGTHQGEMQLHTRPPAVRSELHSHKAHRHTSSTKLGVTRATISSCMTRPRKSHTDTCARMCRTATAGRRRSRLHQEGLPEQEQLFRQEETTAAAGSVGAEAEKQAWLAKYTTAPVQESSAATTSTADQISAVLRDQFGILPKKKIIGYSKPYPNEFDLIPLPPKYRLPDFNKFSGSEGSSSIEHVSRYLAQLGMVSVSDQLRVRFFSQSLTGPAFGWYTSLPPNSVQSWKQLEELFHTQYHSEGTEAGFVIRHGVDKAESSHSRGKDKEEAVPRDRPQDDDRRGTTDVAATTTTMEDIVGPMQQEVSSDGNNDGNEANNRELPRMHAAKEKDKRSFGVRASQGPLPPHNRRAESSQGEDFEESMEKKIIKTKVCHDGLSHSQKHRVQRLRNLEEAEARTCIR